jgi:hypothetical protein
MGDIERAVSGLVSARGESLTFNQGCKVDSDPDSAPEALIV